MEKLNEIERIKEIMGLKTVISEQYKTLYTIYKVGDDFIKGGDRAKSFFNKISGELTKSEREIIKNGDDLSKLLKKTLDEPSLVTQTERSIINKVELALQKLTNNELKVLRREIISDFIKSDVKYQELEVSLTNSIEKMVANQKPTGKTLPSGLPEKVNYTLKEVEQGYKQRCKASLNVLLKNEPLAEELSEIMLKEWKASAHYKALVEEGIPIIKHLPDEVTNKTTKDYINTNGNTDARLDAAISSELETTVGLKKEDIGTLRLFMNKTEFTRRLADLFLAIFNPKTRSELIELNQRLIIDAIERMGKNPNEFIDANTGQLRVNTLRQLIKTNMEGQIKSNPTFAFFNPLSYDGVTRFEYEKLWIEIEKTFLIQGEKQGIPKEKIDALLDALKSSGPKNQTIDKLFDDVSKSDIGLNDVIREVGGGELKLDEIAKTYFKMPKYDLKNKTLLSKLWEILSETISWIGRGRVTSMMTYGVFRTPGLLLKNLTRYGKAPKSLILGLVKTYTELFFLKQIWIPIVDILEGVRKWAMEEMGYDLDVPEGEEFYSQFLRDIIQIFTPKAYTEWETYNLPFKKGPLYKLIEDLRNIDPTINKDKVRKRIETLENEYNKTSSELVKKDQEKFIKKISNFDNDFGSFVTFIKDPKYFERNNINKEESELLYNQIMVRPVKIEGTYEKIKNNVINNDDDDSWLKSKIKNFLPSKRKFEDESKNEGLEYGIIDKSGNIYYVGTAAGFNISNSKPFVFMFKDSDGKIKPIKEFLKKLNVIPENKINDMKNYVNKIKKIILEQEEEKTLKMKDWDEIFTFQKSDEKTPGKFTDVKIKMDSVMDRMPHWRKKYGKQCEELDNCDDDGEDDSFVRAVIDTHPEVVRILFTKGLAHLTSSDDQEDLNEGLHSLLALIREAKNVEVEVWSVYRHPSSPDKIWSLVKGDYKPKELQSMDVKMQKSPGNSVEKKKNSLDELKKKESDAIKQLSLDEKKGLTELPIKVRNNIKEKIKQGWTTEKPSFDLLKFYKEDKIDSVFELPIKIYKLKPNQDFFNFIKSQKSENNIKRGFCRSIYYVKKELDLEKEVSNKINTILNNCEKTFAGKYGQNYI